MLLTPVFNVGSIVVYGNSTVSNEAVIKSSGIIEGTNIFSVSLRRVKDNLEAMSRISSVQVKRILPSTIKITVTEGLPIVYIYDDGDCVGITADGTVTDTVKIAAAPSAPEPEKKTDDGEEADEEADEESDEEIDEGNDEGNNEGTDEEADEETAEPDEKTEEVVPENNLGCAIVTGMGGIKYKTGEKIEFTDEIKAENLYKLLDEFLSDEIYKDVTSIDMSRYNSVSFVYKNSLDVTVGKFENLGYKLQCFKAILSEQIGEDASGELNLELLTYKNSRKQ